MPSVTMIKVGDVVTWRSSKYSLGFAGCTVLELGVTEDGKAAATLDCGRFGEANALVEDLTIEPR